MSAGFDALKTDRQTTRRWFVHFHSFSLSLSTVHLPCLGGAGGWGILAVAGSRSIWTTNSLARQNHHAKPLVYYFRYGFSMRVFKTIVVLFGPFDANLEILFTQHDMSE